LVGSEKYRDSQSLVLRINEFQREKMIDSMNPLSHGYEQGCKVLDALNIMKNAETDANVSKRRKMKNDEVA